MAEASTQSALPTARPLLCNANGPGPRIALGTLGSGPRIALGTPESDSRTALGTTPNDSLRL